MAAPPPAALVPVPSTPAERVRMAWQSRSQSDYIFSFWTAFGWTLLTCGIYGFYIVYQLVRRSKEHNLRRLELLDAATTFAYEQAQAQGLAEELRPSFDTIAQQMATLRQISTEFRDPAIWTILRLLGGIVDMIVFILLDGDLVKHDYAEGAIEHELSTIYGRLGAPVAAPDPARLKQKHNYVGRVIATIATCGIYALWWEYDVMVEGNRHFEHNWAWEDSLANGVQQVIATS
jgi:hypothetical protein